MFPAPLGTDFPMMSKKANAGFYHDGFAYTCEDATQDLVYQ